MATKKFRTKAGVFHKELGHIPEGHVVELEMDSQTKKNTAGSLLEGDPRADVVPDETPVTFDMATGTDLRAQAALAVARAAGLVTDSDTVDNGDPTADNRDPRRKK
jgi:hypothetical protein